MQTGAEWLSRSQQLHPLVAFVSLLSIALCPMFAAKTLLWHTANTTLSLNCSVIFNRPDVFTKKEHFLTRGTLTLTCDCSTFTPIYCSSRGTVPLKGPDVHDKHFYIAYIYIHIYTPLFMLKWCLNPTLMSFFICLLRTQRRVQKTNAWPWASSFVMMAYNGHTVLF